MRSVEKPPVPPLRPIQSDNSSDEDETSDVEGEIELGEIAHAIAEESFGWRRCPE